MLRLTLALLVAWSLTVSSLATSVGPASKLATPGHPVAPGPKFATPGHPVAPGPNPASPGHPVAPGFSPADPSHTAPATHLAMFERGTACMACHNGLTTTAGEDVSIGAAWQASMMAHSARDPYWQAAVRREVLDHPADQAAIEDECSACHMPMARVIAKQGGSGGRIFAHLPVGVAAEATSVLAADGVSCTVCHQIRPDNFGTKASFNGGFVVAPPGPLEGRPLDGRKVFGPFAIDPGRAAVMHSSSRFAPAEGAHVQQSELCATCHSLYTHARGPGGAIVGELPEQTPYGEWLHSAYRQERSCQSCHMPEVGTPTPIASVLGEPRDRLSRHTFVGANAFMLRMLNRYRGDLGVVAPAADLEAAAARTERHLAEATATLSIAPPSVSAGRLATEVTVTSLTGHKLPTGYPARRVWLHLVVRDRAGVVVFESGAMEPDGRIRGNDADREPAGVEPHYATIGSADEVQIYESAMVDHAGRFTTGLLSGVRFVKDNRLLPRGFDKATAPPDVEVRGTAAADPDFVGGSDRIRYQVPVEAAAGPFTVEAVLRYQPIAYRWAMNLAAYDAPEPQRFVRYYQSMASSSASIVATAEARTH